MNDREVGGLRVSREDAESAENARDDFKRQQPSWKISRRPRRPRRFRSSLRPLFGPVRGTGRGERRSPGTISNAELAECLPGKFLGVLGALGVSDRLCVLFSDPYAAPGAGSGGLRRAAELGSGYGGASRRS